jgi:hypothetical protein
VIMLPGSLPWLGSVRPKQPIALAAGQLRQVLLLRRLVAECLNRHHHQAALHTHHAAVARVDALDLARHQPVADIVQSRAAVLLGDGRAEQAELAHLAEDRRVGLLVAEGLLHRGSRRSRQ